MRFSTLGIALAWIIATGCTGGDSPGADREERPPDTADVFVELPPAPSLGDEVQLGAWNWGAPCRVPVREVVGSGGPPIARTFTIELSDDPTSDGFVMAFDDVRIELRGRTEAYWATELYRYLGVLVDMRLDRAGRFVEFMDLDGGLADLASRAGMASPVATASTVGRRPTVVETILDRTNLGWYGFWLDSSRLPLNPDRLVGERRREGGAGAELAETEAFAAPIVNDGPWGEQPPGAMWVAYSERAVGSANGRIDVNTIVDPTNRRPFYVVFRLAGFDDGTAGSEFSTVDRRVVRFDWENAEGCV